MPTTNRRIVMKRIPVGVPTPEDFEIVSEPLGDIEAGQMLLRTRWLTLDRSSCRDRTTWARP